MILSIITTPLYLACRLTGVSHRSVAGIVMLMSSRSWPTRPDISTIKWILHTSFSTPLTLDPSLTPCIYPSGLFLTYRQNVPLAKASSRQLYARTLNPLRPITTPAHILMMRQPVLIPAAALHDRVRVWRRCLAHPL